MAEVKTTTKDVSAGKTAETASTRLFDVKNGNRGLRVIHDARNSPIAIQAGQTRQQVELNENIVRRIKQASKNGLSLSISASQTRKAG